MYFIPLAARLYAARRIGRFNVKVAIIGAGLMGHGLALVFAAGGHDVSITDAFPETLGTVKSRVSETLTFLGWDEAAIERVTPTPVLETAVMDAAFVIEAAPEKLELKQQLFRQIEAAAPVDAILASNTSVIPITKIMAGLKHKQRALGTHWWNPPFLVPLVEVIQTEDTSMEVITRTMALLQQVGKVAVHVKKDVPGFVGNRMQGALWREAISLVENGVCDAETVDLVVKNSFGRRLSVLGPLENADLIGLDLTLDIHRQFLFDLETSKSPSPYLETLVRNGNLGFKSNQGFKPWTEEKKAALRAALREHLKTINELLGSQGEHHGQ
jgi:3-hydroxybutyryl-CoA dehydrogenase